MGEKRRATTWRNGVNGFLIRPSPPRKRTLEGAGNCIRLDHVSPIKTPENGPLDRGHSFHASPIWQMASRFLDSLIAGALCLGVVCTQGKFEVTDKEETTEGDPPPE